MWSKKRTEYHLLYKHKNYDGYFPTEPLTIQQLNERQRQCKDDLDITEYKIIEVEKRQREVGGWHRS